MESKSKKEQDLNRNQESFSAAAYFKHLISLDEGKADESQTIAAIKSGVEFRGSNLWILIFAIFIASIGLNVNSTAVVIGAMLISPLMGPIIGVGLGIGINDLDLIKRGLVNLATAAVISVITSTLYFLITPLNDAQSELLARTTPTLWDVLIATFGGLAGIVAASRKEKTNAIPGVAIATALMPPLCTAGYGLATGNFAYFFGAFYLFFINCVFICLSTFLIVRYLKYSHKEFSDRKQELKVKRLIFAFVVITVLPSIYTGYNVVQKSIFERNAYQFIQDELSFDQAQVVSRNVAFTGKENLIEVLLLGRQVPDSVVSVLSKKLPAYRLEGTKLVVRQGYDKSQEITMYEKLNQNLKASLVEELYKKNEQALLSKDKKIELLEQELFKLRSQELPISDISHEVKVSYPNVIDFSLSKSVMTHLDPYRQDTLLLAYAKFKSRPRSSETGKLKEWLKVRTHADSLKLITDY